jgi:nucleoside-diphosphate-sugar epimerase
VGTGTQTKLKDAVRLARETFDITAEPAWETMPDRTWDTTTWVANADKIERELGWKASIPFDEGFRRFSAWVGGGRERYRT